MFASRNFSSLPRSLEKAVNRPSACRIMHLRTWNIRLADTSSLVLAPRSISSRSSICSSEMSLRITESASYSLPRLSFHFCDESSCLVWKLYCPMLYTSRGRQHFACRLLPHSSTVANQVIMSPSALKYATLHCSTSASTLAADAGETSLLATTPKPVGVSTRSR